MARLNFRLRQLVFSWAALTRILPAQTSAAPAPPGKMVDAGGYRVHLNCAGSGPATVLIVGAGYSFDWSLVQAGVARFTRVCTYDPSGSVWSDPNPAPTCDGRVVEIHTMLRNAGIKGPLVLVGHSIGAVLARLYADRYPDVVQGIIIGDHAGVYRIFNNEGPGSEERILRSLPPAARELHQWAASLPNSLPPSVTRQFMDGCIAQVSAITREKPAGLGHKPLIIIANRYLAASEDYQRFQAALLGLSPNSKALIAANSGHGAPMEEPGIFVRAIQEVLTAVINHSNL